MTPDEVKELMDKGLITQVINPVDIVNNMETEPGPCDYKLPTATKESLGGIMVGTGLYNSSTDNHVKLGIDNGVAGVNYGQGIKKDSSQRLLADIDYIYQQILTKLRNDGHIQ